MASFENIDGVIVGGGPAGLTAGIYLGRYRRSVVVIDSSESRAALIPETHNYPGVIYPVLGCEVRSALGRELGARHNDVGCLKVDAHQRTNVEGLYAVGDVVSDLHQITVGTGHAAVAATHLHNSLPRNFR